MYYALKSLCSSSLHSKENKIFTINIITNTCLSQIVKAVLIFVHFLQHTDTYIYILSLFFFFNKEKYTLFVKTQVKHRFSCTVIFSFFPKFYILHTKLGYSGRG